MVVLLWVEQKGKEKRNAGDKMGCATAQFRPWVVTQEWCRDRLGLARTIEPARDSSTARATVRATWFKCACNMGQAFGVLT